MYFKKQKSVCSFILLLLGTLLFPSSTQAALTYTYDANGNMTSDGQLCYTYNEANQVSKVKKCSNNQLVAEYLYDFQGKRIVKKEYDNGTLKHTIYSPTEQFEKKKLPDNTTQNTTYYFANNDLVAKKNPDNTKVYYHNDHLGSAGVLTNQGGTIVEENTYYPYGEVRSGGINSKYQYTGQEKDSETGLNYFGARYYNSHIQRFAQPDSMLPDIYDPQQLNRFSYVRNNPMKYTDPSGNWLVLASALIDYGWSGYDYFSQQRILWDSHSSPEERLAAQMEQKNILGTEITAILATGGTDSFLPGDDIARLGLKQLSRKDAASALAKVGGNGFSSRYQLYKAIGACHKPESCHHIVEQHADNLVKFGTEQIQNTKNILKLPDGADSIHRKITGWYNQRAKTVFPDAVDGLRVRDVVKQWDYAKQYNYGLEIIENFGGAKYIQEAGLKKL